MSEYVSVRGALADRGGFRATTRIDGVDVIVSPALPSWPTFQEDLCRDTRHRLKNHCDVCTAALRNFDAGPEPGDPTHAVRFGNSIAVSADLFEQLRRQSS